MAKKSEKQYLDEWAKLGESIRNATPIDETESTADRLRRVARLEANHEEWFKYYLPNFYTAEPAPFHIKATQRIMTFAEWYEVRSWARELAKSGRTMMEVLKLSLTGHIFNILLVSNSFDNAKRLLKPFQVILESNNRIIQDYRIQQRLGSWEDGEFTTTKNVSFRALGAGQSPRGTRNNEVRPDAIIIDDIDTDEDCRNEDTINKRVKWIEEALLPTRSVNKPIRVMVNGNIIAKKCCITELAKKADKHDIVNIIDKNGVSTWPNKNSQQNIERLQKTISYNSFQKEYMNNPVTEGTIFKTMTYGACPRLSSCDAVIIYADPATSDKSKSVGGSTKAVVLVGRKGTIFYIYKIFLDTVANATFVDWLFTTEALVKASGVDTYRVYVENNTLQEPFFAQVLYPLIRKREKELKVISKVQRDTRRKPDKFERIEGTLEPKSRNGQLVLNQKEQNDPNMVRLDAQFLGASPTAKMMDGPDAVEGGVWILERRITQTSTNYVAQRRTNQKY